MRVFGMSWRRCRGRFHRAAQVPQGAVAASHGAGQPGREGAGRVAPAGLV